MSEPCTEDQAMALEELYDELDLDGLQSRVIEAVGSYWADDINSRIADLDYEIRTTIRDMQRRTEGC